MKVKHVLIIAAVLLALLVVPAAADENPDIKTDTAEIGLTAPVKFSIDIPAEDFVFKDVIEGSTAKGFIGVDITRINPNSVISLSVSAGDDGWYLKHASNSGDSIAYNMTVDNTEIENGDILLSTATTATKEAIFTLEEDAKKSGKYTDKLTFTAEMKALSAIFESVQEGIPTTISLGAGTYAFPSGSLTKDVTLVCEEGTVFEGTSGLNINGATVIGATFDNPSGNAVSGTVNGVFEDCTFTGSNGLRNCYAGEKVEFDNCVFSGDVYGVHFDGGSSGNDEVIIKNSDIYGWNSFAATIEKVTFENCNFYDNGVYGVVRFYQDAVLKGCTFTFDGNLYNFIDSGVTTNTVTIENCVINNGQDWDDLISETSGKWIIDGNEFTPSP